MLCFACNLFHHDNQSRTRTVDGIKAIDWAGSVFMLGLTLMVLIVLGAAMSVVFVYAEKRLARYLLTPLSIFADWSNVAALAVVFFHGVVLGAAGGAAQPLIFMNRI